MIDRQKEKRLEKKGEAYKKGQEARGFGAKL